jgi:phospho-N-acetylmuramoyl-pentapeptide-transferase
MGLEQAAVVLLCSAMVCLATGPMAIRGLKAMRWVQPMRHEDCPPLIPLQQAKRGVPTMGGLWVLGVLVAMVAMGGGLMTREGVAIVLGLVGCGAIGCLDDLLKFQRPNAKGLSCRVKLLGALGVGALVGWWLQGTMPVLSVPWSRAHLALGWAWVPAAAVVVAGSAHAVNLTDGMDGLAGGCLIAAFGALGAWALTGPLDARHAVIALWCASIVGVCLGFLWFNSAPATVFLGDVGALGLGAALGVIALLADAGLALLVIGGVFVAEAASVMLQVASYRWRNKRRLFRVAPLHHHFHVSGMSESKLVVRFWIVGVLLAALGLTALRHG